MGDVGANIEILPNYNTGKVQLVLNSATYHVDFSTSLFYLLLGFSVAQAGAPIIVTTYGANAGNINNSINSLLLRCDLVSSDASFDSVYGSDIIQTFVPKSAPYSALDLIPNERMYLPVRGTGHIDSIRVYITDQLSRRINLRGEPMSFVLHLRKVKKI